MTPIERAEDMRKILQIGVAWRVGRAVIDAEQAREYERAIAALLDVVEAARRMFDEAVDMGDTIAIREDYWMPFADALARVDGDA